MGILNDYNIVIGQGVVAQHFESLLGDKTFQDELIQSLKQFNFCHPGSIEIIQSNQMVTGLVHS